MKDVVERFKKDVAMHELTVIRADGLYRHLRFKRPASGQYRFDLITWPGHLCYTGDMGTYVFSRLPDMFEFFRGGTEEKPFRLDFRYWAEKCLAEDRDGVRKWSEELFREAVKYDFDSDTENECVWTDERKAELWQAIEDEVFGVLLDGGEHYATRAIHEFEHVFEKFPHETKAPVYRFVDFWDHECREYTDRFVWCCYALRWGICLYDTTSQSAPTQSTSELAQEAPLR